VHDRATQRGFTIIELMIVVAIIAVLAIVVVPSFMKESKRGKSKSEVHPMVSEISTREEQYKLERNEYLPMAACPPSASASGTEMAGLTCVTTPTTTDTWATLRLQSPQAKLTCSYLVGTDLAGVDPTAHGDWPSWATNSAGIPAVSWYFIRANCPDTQYLWASWDTKIKSQDGK
jgi:type IV pilus assembly protein PilE